MPSDGAEGEGEEPLNVSPDGAEGEGEGEAVGPDLLEGTVPGEFVVRPGVEIATVLGAGPGEPLTLYDREGMRLVTVISDDAGQAHFAYVPVEHQVLESGEGTTIPLVDGGTLKPGEGYVIRNDAVAPPTASGPFAVLHRDDPPDPTLYEAQELVGVQMALLGGVVGGAAEEDGFQYIEVRDGVSLSAMVRFPDPALYGPGPWPTVVEYSGYSPSRPSGAPSGSRIVSPLGYATVGVNMRGTGCSGGVFDVFNPAQHADGYDVIEVVARQPWVLHNKVGMVGLSYAGISQLYVASTQPPSLAAITPQSVIGDAWEMQWPGGVYNSGFTEQWVDNRESDARAGGGSWFQRRVDAGDAQCADNLRLRSQNVDFEPFLKGLEFYPPDGLDRSLPRLVADVTVPVYLTGAFQDEQTGPLFMDMLDRFGAAPLTRFTLYNGRHPDGYSPLVISRWFEFLDLFVARKVPRLSPLIRTGAGAEFARSFGAPGLELEPDRFADLDADDLDGALARYDEDPQVRVLFENGAGADTPGAPVARYEGGFDEWPPAEAEPWSWYLSGEGALSLAAPVAIDGDLGTDRYGHDEDAGGATFFGPAGYELMTPLWDLDWTRFAPDMALSYLTPPLPDDVLLAGPGHATLWMRAAGVDANVQVTLTEITPDDEELLLQSGRLRLGHRAVDPEGTIGQRTGRPYTTEAYAPLPLPVPVDADPEAAQHAFVQARVAIPSVAHALRAGSRLRVTISVPGRDHGTWEFDNPTYPADEDAAPLNPAEAWYEVARNPDHPSAVTLSILAAAATASAGIEIPPDRPPCPSLRGQPCRTYLAP